jgi:DNA-binding response OmpR family regulator
MLRQVLERAGYEVIEARDGEEGVRYFHAFAIDLVITDVLMPGKRGLDAIIELRSKVPDVKIIAISGGGYLGDLSFLEAAKQVGARSALQKPFELRELLEAVREAIDGP